MKKIPQDIEVVSFRISREILDQLDRLARDDMRTRANLVLVLLERLLGTKKALISNLERLVKTINEQEEKDPNSPLTEYFRGRLGETKDMLALLYGPKEKDRALDQIRKRTGLPIPHVVPLYEDGQRCGLDLDAW